MKFMSFIVFFIVYCVCKSKAVLCDTKINCMLTITYKLQYNVCNNRIHHCVLDIVSFSFYVNLFYIEALPLLCMQVLEVIGGMFISIFKGLEEQ